MHPRNKKCDRKWEYGVLICERNPMQKEGIEERVKGIRITNVDWEVIQKRKSEREGKERD